MMPKEELVQILIASKTLKVTQALREFTQEQAEKLTKLNQRVSQIRVFLEKTAQGSKRNNDAVIKFVVSLPGKTVAIKHKSHDMYQGIMEATDRAFRQVRKQKEKRLTQQRRVQLDQASD